MPYLFSGLRRAKSWGGAEPCKQESQGEKRGE